MCRMHILKRRLLFSHLFLHQALKSRINANYENASQTPAKLRICAYGAAVLD